MPVTPFQAFRLSSAEYEVLRVVEDKVDGFIGENYYPGLTVTVNLPSKMVTERILHSIIQRYAEAGWTVQRTPSDDEEQIIIDFIPNRPDLA
ncbi:MAG: hypothetical protein ORN98_06230 [Alphaproteobacteria bacterium]|nr:hypothetical protein [Alphaproteobacteria bacterium]